MVHPLVSIIYFSFETEQAQVLSIHIYLSRQITPLSQILCAFVVPFERYTIKTLTVVPVQFINFHLVVFFYL